MSATTTADGTRSERAAGPGPVVGAGGGLLPAAALVLAGALLAPGPAAAQEGPLAPPTAEAPADFRLGPAVSVIAWEETDGGNRLDDVTLWGLGVERLVASFLAVRLDGGYGTASVTSADGGRTVDVNSYLADLALSLRAPALPLSDVSVVPYGVAGLGTVVHDPSPDDLTTASQNALSYGLGVDVRPLASFGARLEWRRYTVDLEDLFDPVERTGSSRGADRFSATVYWAF